MEKSRLAKTVAAARGGDESAFEALYLEFAKQIYYLALKIMRNKEDAEDITQEVFITVSQKIGELKEPKAFGLWLNRITASKCTDAFRKKGDFTGQDIAEFDETELAEETDPLLLPEKSLDDTETSRMIVEIVDTLPDAQRLCIYYYYYEQLTVAQIAEILATNENAVKRRLYLARDKIRKALEKLNDEEGLKLYSTVPLMLTPALKLPLQSFALPQELERGLWVKIKTTSAVTVKTAAAGTAAAAKTIGAMIAGIALSGLIIRGAGLPNREELPPEVTTPQKAAITEAAITTAPKPITEVNAATSKPETTESAESAAPPYSPFEEIDPLAEPPPNFIVIKGIEYGTDLTELELPFQNLQNEDIVPLMYMTNLTRLNLVDNQISDITPLSNLTNLTVLSLDYNQISDLTPLSDLTNLTELGLMHNHIDDITPLGNLTNVTRLNLWDNPIEDWSPVADIDEVSGRP